MDSFVVEEGLLLNCVEVTKHKRSQMEVFELDRCVMI